MIAPDMATMLSFVFTDAPIAAAALAGAAAQPASSDTFNAVTVDSDTSTSDTLLLFATGAAAKRGAPKIARRQRSAADAFAQGARRACSPISPQQVVRDGEGARKFVEVSVEGAVSNASARKHRAVDRQFAAGQDRDRRRGRQLGPRRHGRRQGRRAGRPRPARDLVRRHPRRPQGRARPGL